MSNLNDCFVSVKNRLTLAEAIDRFSKGIGTVVEAEEIPLIEAVGRILASDLMSNINVPPQDNSAVDGYLVYFEDLDTNDPTTMPLTGRIAAGHPLSRFARRGEALSIFTGAQVPTGELGCNPDTIFMLEDANIRGKNVVLPAGQHKGSNLRKAGEDVRSGDLVLKCGQRLRPQDVGMVAALG